MTEMKECPACGKRRIADRTYARDLEFKGIDLHVDNLVGYECLSCEYHFETHEQHNANICAIRNAFLDSRRKYKVKAHLLTGEQIKRARKDLKLTQHQASRIFGGGLNAFSKYENEEIVQSVAMDRLIRLVAKEGLLGLQKLHNATSYVPGENEPVDEAQQSFYRLSGFLDVQPAVPGTAISIEPILQSAEPCIRSISNRTSSIKIYKSNLGGEHVMQKKAAYITRGTIKEDNVLLFDRGKEITAGSGAGSEFSTYERNPKTVALFRVEGNGR